MATTYDKASLVMIPSGYKDDKLYSVKPTDGSGDFTFSRDGAGASPATRVNASGLIEKGRTNELLQSNTFDTTWFLNGLPTLTGGQSGYDGSSDAWSLAGTGTQYASVRQTIALSEVVTLSVYAKAGTQDFLAMNTGGSSTAAWFDLSNGTLGSTDTNVIDSAIESIGGGWYRCSMSIVGIAEFRIYVTDADNNFGTAIGNIYIQDAQLEQGLVATDYIETTTAAVSDGLLGDMPRLDYSGGATCPSLLLEPSRVNVLDHSEYFDAWIKANISVANNVSTSPEGVQNATTIEVVSDTSFSSLRRNISVSANSTYTMSLFVKKETSETNYMGLGFVYSGGTTDVGYVIIDSVNGTALSADPRIDVITNVVDFGDYWRIEATATDSGSNTSLAVYIYATLSINGTSVAVGGGSARTIYGAQLEEGSYPTSYIPTYGSASTRGADACSKTGITSLIGQSEGTLFVEYTSNHTGGAGERIFAIGDGTSSNRIVLFEASNKIRVYAADGGALQWDVITSVDFEGTHKIAVTYAANSAAIYIDGTQLNTDTSFVVPSCGNVYLGTSEVFGVSIGGSIKEAILFDSALTQSEAEALTTL